MKFIIIPYMVVAKFLKVRYDDSGQMHCDITNQDELINTILALSTNTLNNQTIPQFSNEQDARRCALTTILKTTPKIIVSYKNSFVLSDLCNIIIFDGKGSEVSINIQPKKLSQNRNFFGPKNKNVCTNEYLDLIRNVKTFDDFFNLLPLKRNLLSFCSTNFPKQMREIRKLITEDVHWLMLLAVDQPGTLKLIECTICESVKTFLSEIKKDTKSIPYLIENFPDVAKRVASLLIKPESSEYFLQSLMQSLNISIDFTKSKYNWNQFSSIITDHEKLSSILDNVGPYGFFSLFMQWYKNTELKVFSAACKNKMYLASFISCIAKITEKLFISFMQSSCQPNNTDVDAKARGWLMLKLIPKEEKEKILQSFRSKYPAPSKKQNEYNLLLHQLSNNAKNFKETFSIIKKHKHFIEKLCKNKKFLQQPNKILINLINAFISNPEELDQLCDVNEILSNLIRQSDPDKYSTYFKESTHKTSTMHQF